MKYLLDTNVVVRFLTGRNSAVVARCEAEANNLSLCAPVKAELLAGAHKSARVEENLRVFDEFFTTLPSLDFDDNAAEHYSQIRSQLQKSGTPIGPMDLLIASIARANALISVTHNSGVGPRRGFKFGRLGMNMSDFTTLYRDFFQTIGCPLKPTIGAEWNSSIPAPDAVAQFYEVAGKAEEWTQSYSRFLAPESWESDDFYAFIEENQGVMLWGFRRDEAAKSDPPIYQATYESNAPLQWESLELSCSQFILLTLAMQPFEGEVALPVADKTEWTPGLEDKITAAPGWKKVVEWEEDRESIRQVFIRQDALLCLTFWVEGPTLFCGTHTKKQLRQIGRELGVKWDGGLF